MQKSEVQRRRPMTASDFSTEICARYQPAEECEPLSENPWLKIFADGVSEFEITAEVCRTLQERHYMYDISYMSYMTEYLYLYTHPKSTFDDVRRDRTILLVAKLDSAIHNYDKLIDSLNDCIPLIDMRSRLSISFSDDLGCILAGRKYAREAREYAKANASKKKSPRGVILDEMALIMERVTGKRNPETLLNLISIAHYAHGNKGGKKLDDAKSLDRRITRYRNRPNLPIPSTTNPKSPEFSLKDFFHQLKLDVKRE